MEEHSLQDINKSVMCTFISDTHNNHHELTDSLPGGDIICHSGDFMGYGVESELYNFLNWYNELPYKHKIFIAGNHDWLPYKNGILMRNILEQFPAIHYLEDKFVQIEGFNFYGSPWTPKFFNWAFMKDRGHDLDMIWYMIPDDIDVLLTHGPAFGLGDWAYNKYENTKTATGCLALLDHMKRVKPLVHSFGHIHEGYGKYISEELKETLFINASSVNSRYMVVNKPIVVDLEKLSSRRAHVNFLYDLQNH